MSGSRTFHRFFSSSPISPSGRYLAALRAPFEHRPITPGTFAEVVVADLSQPGGATAPLQHGSVNDELRPPTLLPHVVARTAAWDSQLGAQVQWGASDARLYFNVMDEAREAGASGAEAGEWRVRGVEYDPRLLRETRRLPCPLYHVSRNGRFGVSPDLRLMRATQDGYGVRVPDRQYGPLLRTHLTDLAARGGGRRAGPGSLLLTNLTSGACRPIATTGQIAAALQLRRRAQAMQKGRIDWRACAFFPFHASFNPQADRILHVVRARGKGCSRSNHAVAMGLDGGAIRLLVSWREGRRITHPRMLVTCARHVAHAHARTRPLPPLAAAGNHPKWMSDGRRISINYKGRICRFADDDGPRECTPLSERSSGHPTDVAAEVPLILADTYAKEFRKFGLRPGTAMLRLIHARRPGAKAHPGCEIAVRRGRGQPTDHGGGRPPPAPVEASAEAPLGVFIAGRTAANGSLLDDRAWRCDLHPAWDGRRRRVAINVLHRADGESELSRHVAVLSVGGPRDLLERHFPARASGAPSRAPPSLRASPALRAGRRHGGGRPSRGEQRRLEAASYSSGASGVRRRPPEADAPPPDLGSSCASLAPAMLPAARRTSPRQIIFGAGEGTTGTRSISMALARLGLASMHAGAAIRACAWASRARCTRHGLASRAPGGGTLAAARNHRPECRGDAAAPPPVRRHGARAQRIGARGGSCGLQTPRGRRRHPHPRPGEG